MLGKSTDEEENEMNWCLREGKVNEHRPRAKKQGLKSNKKKVHSPPPTSSGDWNIIDVNSSLQYYHVLKRYLHVADFHGRSTLQMLRRPLNKLGSGVINDPAVF